MGTRRRKECNAGLGWEACDEGACAKPSNLDRGPSWRPREPVDAPSWPSSLLSAGSRRVAQGPGSRLGGHRPPGSWAPEGPERCAGACLILLGRPGDPQKRKVPRGPAEPRRGSSGAGSPRAANTCASPLPKPMKAASGLGPLHLRVLKAPGDSLVQPAVIHFLKGFKLVRTRELLARPKSIWDFTKTHFLK